MNENLLNFKNIEWESPRVGLEQKVFSDGNQKIRLVRFFDNFVEEDGCTNGHIGYVLEGEMEIDFNGTIKSYKKGDGLWIKEGKDSIHKLIVKKGKQVELILFEGEK